MIMGFITGYSIVRLVHLLCNNTTYPEPVFVAVIIIASIIAFLTGRMAEKELYQEWIRAVTLDEAYDGDDSFIHWSEWDSESE